MGKIKSTDSGHKMRAADVVTVLAGTEVRAACDATGDGDGDTGRENHEEEGGMGPFTSEIDDDINTGGLEYANATINASAAATTIDTAITVAALSPSLGVILFLSLYLFLFLPSLSTLTRQWAASVSVVLQCQCSSNGTTPAQFGFGTETMNFYLYLQYQDLHEISVLDNFFKMSSASMLKLDSSR